MFQYIKISAHLCMKTKNDYTHHNYFHSFSIDEDLVTLVHSWNSMISMMATTADMSSSSSSSDIEKLVAIVKEDITNALHTHSEYAIGRLHQTLLQFLDMKSMAMMLNIPKAFITAIENFIAAKVSASISTSLIAKIKQFVSNNINML